MLTVLRKVRKSLFESGSTRKYLLYAIGEIALVVIGILIALQINNWNEERKKIKKEDSLISAIHKEFLQNRNQLDTVLKYHHKALTSCDSLIAMFPINIEKVALSEIGNHLWNITWHWTFNPSQGSVNGITNTSSFDIIRNDELRELLISWKNLIQDFQENELVGKHMVQNHIDPLLAKHIDYYFNLNDKRNDFSVLETLEFEYFIHSRQYSLWEILKGEQFKQLEQSLNRIIELTSP